MKEDFWFAVNLSTRSRRTGFPAEAFSQYPPELFFRFLSFPVVEHSGYGLPARRIQVPRQLVDQLSPAPSNVGWARFSPHFSRTPWGALRDLAFGFIAFSARQDEAFERGFFSKAAPVTTNQERAATTNRRLTTPMSPVGVVLIGAEAP